jgi:hypothetical protein
MVSTRGQSKARLMKQAEKVIDELLDWRDMTSEPNLTQIEVGFPQKSGHRDKRKWCIIRLLEGNYGKAPQAVHN